MQGQPAKAPNNKVHSSVKQHCVLGLFTVFIHYTKAILTAVYVWVGNDWQLMMSFSTWRSTRGHEDKLSVQAGQMKRTLGKNSPVYGFFPHKQSHWLPEVHSFRVWPVVQRALSFLLIKLQSIWLFVYSPLLNLRRALCIAWRLTRISLSFTDGRQERVMFDKITSRIQKLCYGLNPDFVDPVCMDIFARLVMYI